LFRLAELAHGARDYATLEEISHALEAIPFPPAQRAASYYAAIIAKRAGQLDTAAAMLVTLDAPRAIQTLATVREMQGQWSEATHLHAEAMRRAKDVDGLALVNAHAQLAIIKSSAGDHHSALASLQELWPMVRVVAKTHPHLYPQWCNALAVELTEVGKLDAARTAINVALASPTADRFPEYQATAAELRELERVALVVPVVQHQTAAQPQARISATCGEWRAAISHQPLAIGHRSPVIGQPRARAPGILERVKRSARDRDGPFVNVK
jgi:hypothetical protein